MFFQQPQPPRFQHQHLPQSIQTAVFGWWIEQCPIEDTPYLFVCLEDTPYCQEYYGQPFKVRQHFMHRLCERTGVKPFGFHAIRPLSASTLYKNKCSIAEIQAILRHKSLNTNVKYLKSLGLEDVRGAIESLAKREGDVVEFAP